MWLNADNEAIWNDNTLSNKTFKVKLSVIAEPKVKPDILKLTTGENGTTASFLGGPITRQNIEEVIFTDTNTVPSGVIGSWDVSAAENGSIMAWYENTGSSGRYKVTIGQNGGVYANPNSTRLFNNLRYVINIDVTKLNTFFTTNMEYMFDYAGYNSSTFAVNGLNTWDLTGVTTLDTMFNRAGNATNDTVKFDVGLWDVSNVANLANLFCFAGNNSSNLILNMSKWDVSSATSIEYIIYGTGQYTNNRIIDLSNWDTSKVTNATYAFGYLGLYANNVKINLSNWKISTINNMNTMFWKSNLSELRLDNWTVPTAVKVDMFSEFPTSAQIYVKNNEMKDWILDGTAIPESVAINVINP